MKDPISSLTIVPDDQILGDESKYTVICRKFSELIFEENFDLNNCSNFDLDDMNAFFASFASQSALYASISLSNQLNHIQNIYNDVGFKSTVIYSGYKDDPRNTDNAWVEVEVWNFHYDKEESFDVKIKNSMSKWREVTLNVRINSNEIVADALKEVSEIHNAFYH